MYKIPLKSYKSDMEIKNCNPCVLETKAEFQVTGQKNLPWVSNGVEKLPTRAERYWGSKCQGGGGNGGKGLIRNYLPSTEVVDLGGKVKVKNKKSL